MTMRTLVFLLLTACAAVPLAAGEEPPPDGDDPPPVVYLPYEEVDAVDPAGRGVFLPYERFIELWEARRQQEDDPPPPPVGAVLATYALRGRVAEESAEFAIEGTVTGLKEEWTTVDLPAALAFASFAPEDPGLTLERRPGKLRLHLPRAGSFPFAATSAAAVTRDASGRRSLALVLPDAASGSLELVLPDAALEVDLQPRVPATLVKEEGTTRIRALLGGQRQLTVSWRGEVQEELGPAMLLADTSIACTVSARAVQYRLLGTVKILRNAAPAVSVDLPADTQVIAVRATELASWDVEDGCLELRFQSPRKGPTEVDLTCERKLPSLAAGTARDLTLDQPRVHDAARHTGHLVLVAGEGMSLQVLGAEGYSQINPGETGIAGAAAAYRYLAVPGPLAVRQTRLESELRGQVHQWVRLGREEDRVLALVDLEVRKAGRFAVTVQAPADWELLDLTGPTVDEVRPAEGAADGRSAYTVSLEQKLLGTTRLVFRFRAPPSVPRATDAAVEPFPGRLLRLDDAKQVGGELLLSAPGSWALTTVERSHLATAKVAQVRNETPLQRFVRELDENEVLALAFTFLRQDTGLRLRLAPRSRELKLRQEQLFTVGSAQVRGALTWHGEVRYSALPTLRIVAPTTLDERLVFKAVDLAEQEVVERADGVSTWELRFAAPVLGSFRVSASFTRDLEAKLAAGESRELELPVIGAADVTRLDNVQAVARDGSLEIKAAAPGLDEIAAADLPPGLQASGVVAAFRGDRAAALALEVVRHDLLALADAGVPVVGYRGVVGVDRVARVLGVADLISRGRPYLIIALPAGAEMLEVAVDGHQPRTSQREDGNLVVPLGESAGARRQRVSFVYELPLGEGQLGALGGVELALPRIGIQDEDTKPLAVDRTEAVVHLPGDYRLTSSGGDLAHRDGGGLWRRLMSEPGPVLEPGTPLDGKTGLTVQLRPIGRAHRFARIGEGGSIRLGLISETALAWLAILAAVAGLLAAWFARRYPPALAGLLLLVAVALLGGSGPWLEVVAAFAGGMVLCPVLLALRGTWRLARRWRRERKHLVPVPAALMAGGEAPAPAADAARDVDEVLAGPAAPPAAGPPAEDDAAEAVDAGGGIADAEEPADGTGEGSPGPEAGPPDDATPDGTPEREG